jgi:hypothetical protein
MPSDKTYTASYFDEITPDDNADVPSPAGGSKSVRAIYVGGDGNLAVTDWFNNTATFAVFAGQILPIQPKRVLSTGTTATGLVALG